LNAVRWQKPPKTGKNCSPGTFSLLNLTDTLVECSTSLYYLIKCNYIYFFHFLFSFSFLNINFIKSFYTITHTHVIKNQ
jgi:hypothetical protein